MTAALRVIEPSMKLPTIRQSTVPVVAESSPWEVATDKHRMVANQRHYIVDHVGADMELGASLNHAVNYLISRVEVLDLPAVVIKSCKVLGRGNKPPSAPTIKRWVKAFIKHGREGLLPSFKGRTRKDYGWEADAIALYNQPSKPPAGAVAFNLRKMGWNSATNSRVLRYINSLPASLGSESKYRVGKHEHHLTHAPSKIRDTNCLLVGEVYQGDGHTIDAYLAHPITGKVWRPEMTIWIDIRSRYITGWYLSDAESSLSTLFSLSAALLAWDHVPAWLHIDNGSGFKAKLLNDPSIGYYERFDMSTMFSWPGNPRGKGHVERWFKELRDKHDKFWNKGLDYCGHDQAAETNRRISVEVNAGRRKLLSLHEYKQGVAEFIEQYHNEVHSELDGLTPNQVWNGLQNVPVEMEADAIIRPQEIRKVRKYAVRIHNRTYKADTLRHYDGQEVVIEYDLHDDNYVTIYDDEHRRICQAKLVSKIAYLPDSRLEEGRQKREKGQLKRLATKIAETKARSARTIGDQNSQKLELLNDRLIDDQTDNKPALTIDLSDFYKGEDDDN